MITQLTSAPKYGLPEKVLFCRRCVISNQRPSSCNEFEHTSDSPKRTIHLDAEGICDACRVAERKQSIDWKERGRELESLLGEYRSTDSRFDVLVPGSGGKDSFLAAITLKKMGMHPLLVTWAPSLYTQIGRANLEAWQRLAPHLLVTPNREVNRLLVRLSIETLFHPFACFIYGQKALAPKIAEQYGIRLVMFGEHEGEYGNPKAEFDTAIRARDYYSSDSVHLGGVPLRELRDRFGMGHSDLSLYLPPDPEALEMVDVRYLGYYVRWHPQGAFYAASEHGFEVAPERTPGTYSKYNSLDDKLDDFHYWTTYQKFGIGRATYDASQEIRSGDITREEGVSLVKRFDGEWPARFTTDVNDYLSVEGFPRMTNARWLELAEKFRSPHLWDGDNLRHVVA